MEYADFAQGVMLCERPAAHKTTSSFIVKEAFKPPSCPTSNEHLGLTPIIRAANDSPKKRTFKVLDDHLRYMRTLAEQHQRQQAQKEEQERLEHEKTASVHNFTEKLRKSILAGRDVSGFWKPAEQQVALRTMRATANSSCVLQEQQTTEGCDIRNQPIPKHSSLCTSNTDCTAAKPPCSIAIEGAVSSLPAAPPSASAEPTPVASAEQDANKAKGKGKSRPAWALTAEQVTALEQEEEAELLKFTEELDYEETMKKLEEVDILQAIEELEDRPASAATWRKHFVALANQAHRVVERHVDGSEPADGRPTTSASKCIPSEANKSTNTTDQGGQHLEDITGQCNMPRNTALELLKVLPDLGKVHSAASVRAMLEKVVAQQ